LLTDNKLRQGFGENARKRYQQMFTSRLYSDAVEMIYLT
jgi:hypothetical protein